MDRGVQETAGFLGGEQVSSTVSRSIVALQRLISRTDYSSLFVKIQQKKKKHGFLDGYSVMTSTLHI
jgi:hypothetical protein